MLCSALGAYRPVIIFHGIFSDAANMDDLQGMIQAASPGTQIHNIDGYDNWDSMKPMWEQVNSIKSKMVPIMEQQSDGVHLICFSQGVFDTLKVTILAAKVTGLKAQNKYRIMLNPLIIICSTSKV